MANNLIALKNECRALYLSGKSYKQISKELGVAKSTLSYWCKDIVRPVKTKARVDAKGESTGEKYVVDHSEVIRLWEAYETQRTIATLLKINISTVNRICRGLKRDQTLVKRKSAGLIGQKGKGPYSDWHLYFSKDKYGAKVVHMVHAQTRRRLGMRYARYLMSVHLNRILDKNEVVKYKNGILDEIDNLEITLIRQDVSDPDYRKIKPCLQCKQEFESKTARAKYCSSACKNAFNDARDKPIRICRGCKTEFTSGSRSQRYCSADCRSTNAPPSHPERLNRPNRGKGPKKVECVVCEGKFIPNDPNRDYCYSTHCVTVIESEVEE